MIIRGLVSGEAHGTARARNAAIAERLYDVLPGLRGFDLGTLNVAAISPPDLKIARLEGPGRVSVEVPETRCEWRKRPLKAETISFLPVEFSVPGKVSLRAGYLYLASRSSRPRRGILELMSRENLRQTYGVEDGDEVEVFLASPEQIEE